MLLKSVRLQIQRQTGSRTLDQAGNFFYKWRCSWENHLYLGDFPLPCLITKLKSRFRFCASRHREEGPRKGAVVHKPKGRPILGLSPENLGRWIGTQLITIWL